MDTSSIFTVTINLPPPFPNFGISGNVLTANVFGTYLYQWFLNDTALAGATLNTYTALVSGNYRLQITDTNGCVRKSFPVSVVITGLKIIEDANELTIFPNPALNEVTFTLTKAMHAALEISNQLGTVIYKSELKPTANKLNLSNWEKGIYYVKVISNNSQRVKKLVLQ